MTTPPPNQPHATPGQPPSPEWGPPGTVSQQGFAQQGAQPALSAQPQMPPYGAQPHLGPPPSGGRGPFDPEGLEFRPVSPGLIRVRYISAGIPLLILLAAVVVLFVLEQAIVAVIGLLVFSVVVVWLGWLIPRQVKAIGYAEAQEDLVIRRGIMFRSMRVVPYGRMQFVDVQQGPLDRAFGVSEVRLHTAAATTDASLPGLAAEEAARLRDRLTARGEARLAGL